MKDGKQFLSHEAGNSQQSNPLMLIQSFKNQVLMSGYLMQQPVSILLLKS